MTSSAPAAAGPPLPAISDLPCRKLGSQCGALRVTLRVGSLEGEAPFRYLRLREPPYSDGELAAWADRIRSLLNERLRVYCYFMHEDEPTAPRYAERLLELLAR